MLDEMAPFETAEHWDNAGLMVGDPDQIVHSALVALDPGFDVIRHAIQTGCDLIITHHPLIFRPLVNLDLARPLAKKISMLIKAGISLVSMHTNLDKCASGVADTMAGALGLKDVKADGAMRTGTIAAPVPLAAWIGALPFRGAKVVDAGKDVSFVGMCPGSGMDYWLEAFDMGCDTFVTGDVRYHAAVDARDAGMNVIDLGHFATEEIAIGPVSAMLQEKLQGIEVTGFKGKDVFISQPGKEREY